MARLGRIQETIIDSSGNALSGVSVEIRRQGSTVDGDQTGLTSGNSVTVNDPGEIASSDTCEIWSAETTQVASSGGTTTFNVDSVTATTVALSGYSGTLAVSDEDRISPTNSLPTLYNDALSGETLANPLTTDANGQAVGWAIGGFYDRHISGGDATETHKEDLWVHGEHMVSKAYDGATQDGWKWDTAALSTSGANHTSWLVNGSEVAYLDKDGGIVLSAASTISAGGLTVTAGGITITAGGLLVSAGGITVTGNSTITGTLGGLTGLTVASGGLTVTAGGATITAGGMTVTAGGLTVSASGITVTGNSTIAGTLGSLTGLTLSSGFLNFPAATELTISSGAITITQNVHKIQPESGTSDTLSTINGGTEGQEITLYTSDSGDTITIDENGNIILDNAAPGTITLHTVAATLGKAAVKFYFNGTSWLYIS